MPYQKRRGFSFIRFIFWLLGLAVAVAILIPIAFLLFFDPNHYKSEIATLIHKKSGLPLTIDGKITVHYFPWLGFQAEKVTLPQPAAFGTGKFIHMDEMEFKVPVRALLNGHFSIEELELKGLNVSLIQNRDGTSNWQYYRDEVKRSLSAKSDNTGEIKPVVDEAAPTKKSLTFDLKQFNVTDAALQFEDKAQNQIVSLDKLQIKGTDQGEGTFYLDTDFNVDLKTQNRTQLTGHGKIFGDLALKKLEVLKVKSQFALQLFDYPKEWEKLDLNAALVINEKAILINDLLIKSRFNATGDVSIPFAAQLPIGFNLKLNEINLDQLPLAKTQTTQAKAATPSTEKASSISKGSSGTSKGSRKMQGDVTIERVLTKDLILEEVKARVVKENSIIKLSPLTARLYQGKLSTTISKDLNFAQGPVNIQGTINNMDLKQVLQSLKKEQRLSGQTNLDFSLQYFETAGVQGTVKCKINQGALQGVDVKYYLLMAQAMLKNEKNNAVDSHSTSFSELSATLRLHDNIIDNNDLVITSPDFKANGEGSINFAQDMISYKLKVERQYQDGGDHKNALPLALRIKGSLNHPKVEPDLDVYIKTRVKDEVNKQLNKQIEKQLHKHLDKYISKHKDDTPADPNAPVDPNAPAPEKEDPIDKAIKKGLDKLFK